MYGSVNPVKHINKFSDKAIDCNEVCHICKTNKRNIELICNHTICNVCVDQISNKCPYCGTNFTEYDQIQDQNVSVGISFNV